ncbi:arrestin domain-containing protein 3-like [Anneissia japonica]|uniref:arrestin domain-containing protein 3-like n=1 Tax=Anneissia japonica TaxID=1529436 RepID=UPI0014254CD3|nr:arrestin domain-containing protein 3-like [Anneissia japonica]
MGRIQDLSIILDNTSAVYRVGESISGSVSLTLSNSTKIPRISIHLLGKSMVHFGKEPNEDNDGGGDDDDDDKNKKNDDSEVYLDEYKIIWGGADASTIFAPGKNNLRFEFVLPSSCLPTSFEGEHGYVRYWLDAEIDPGQFTFDKKSRKIITVINRVDLTHPTYTVKISANKEKVIRNAGCCSKQHKIYSNLVLERRSYSPGESLIYSGEIMNSSKKKAKPSISFHQKSTYTREEKSKVIDKVVAAEDLQTVNKQDTQNWTNFALQMPPIPPSFKCKSIEVEYYLKLSLKVSRSKEISVCIPVLIGTVPLPTSLSPSDNTATLSSSSSSSGFGRSKSMSTEFLLSSSASHYASSVFGPVDMDTSDKVIGDSKYIPMYSFFNPT